MKTKINGYKRGYAGIMAFLAGSVFAIATPEAISSEGKDIVALIEMEMASDTRMEGSNVSAKFENGIVILNGRVGSLDRAERAAERAMAVAGVRAVVNRIELSAAPRSDTQIKAAVAAALKKNGALDAKRISTDVKEGVVTLRGEVSTWDEQEIAREVASNVPGVIGIDNRTEVIFDSPRTDDQIRMQLAGLIENDPLYDGLHLSVSVKEGVVRLKGEVGTKSEYDRLVRRSSVTGVFEVNADLLKVNSDLAMEALEDKHFSPEQMNLALADAVKADDRIDSNAITFQLSEGIVTLEGMVKHPQEKFAAESTSRGVPGVIAVNNRLRVSEGRPEVAANAPLMTPR
jgi:osmotically-inducible protein OsmY